MLLTAIILIFTGTANLFESVNCVNLWVLCYHSAIMHARRRLFSYLLINILVSALVTGTIIYFYDLSHRSDCKTVLPVSTTPAPGSLGVNVNVVGVIGAGTLSDERIVIRNDGKGSVVLTGWYLKDTKGTIYTFPQLTIFPGGKIQVHTKSGSNNAADLYWNRTASIWSSGELVALYDTQSIARAFYRVP
jgi:hypothetical protein